MSMLLTKQFAFAQAIARLIIFIPEEGRRRGELWNVKFGEGYVAETDKADGDYDGPHLKGGAHYNGLGQDLLIFNAQDELLPGSHKAYMVAGAYFRNLNPLARWGGNFSNPDPDHFSFEHDGRQ